MRCSGGTLEAGQEVSADALASKHVQQDQFQQQVLFNETPF